MAKRIEDMTIPRQTLFGACRHRNKTRMEAQAIPNDHNAQAATGIHPPEPDNNGTPVIVIQSKKPR
jgi:hypothetical protein